MKEGWKKYTLGEICEKITDGSHNPPKGIDNSAFLMISSQNVFDRELNFENVRFLSEEDFNKENARTQVKKGDVLLTIVGTIGRTCVVRTDKKFALQRSVAVLSPKPILIPEYFCFSLIGLRKELNAEANGIAQKGIYLKQLAKFEIPVPPLSEQQQIVEELDLLSGIIEKKKEQLKELDNLAQSIFYEMFNESIAKENGWEILKIGDVCETTSGGTPSKSHPEYYEGGKIPWLRSGEVAQGLIYKTEMFITEEGLKKSSAKYVPVDSVAIAMYGATVGQVGIIKTKMCTNQAICSILPNDIFMPIYLCYFLMGKKPLFLKDAVGGAQPNISQGMIKNTSIVVPPLPLQQSFASKIEAIEKQKALIKQSITETETLFNSRMDYYFG